MSETARGRARDQHPIKRMADNKLRHIKQWGRLLAAHLVGLLVLAAWSGLSEAQQAPGKPQKPDTAPSVQAEPTISQQEAEELFRSVDDILRFASKDTSLPIKQEVKRALTNRDDVQAYLLKNMAEDKDAERLRRSELVLKKFGLLPRDFDLQAFLPTLLREQVAGYYDPKTKTVHLLNWLSAEQQKPVLAHELTHALQDQSFDLPNWMKANRADLASVDEPTPADFAQDEAAESRQAVVEGQAMVTLIDYMLVPFGKSLKDSPELLATLKQGMLSGTADSVQFRNAPACLRDALTFPYLYGIDFVAEVARSKGATKTFAAMFHEPPLNTRQVMEPQTYLSGEKLAPMPLPNLKQRLKDYERFDVGAFGEFDVSMLVKQYAGEDAAQQMYPHWRGGYYYAGRPKSPASAPLGLLYVSRWSDAAHASQFAAIYAKSLLKRYKQANQTIADKMSEVKLASLDNLTGTHTWQTEEGPVHIEVQRDLVMITESLDQATTERLALDLFPAAVVAER